MARFNFTGGSYTSQAVGFSAQRCLNLYPEIDESGDAKSRLALWNTPGIRSLCFLDGPPRGQYEFNGRLFVAGSLNFYEIIPTFDINGVLVSATANVLNAATPLVNDNLPVSMAANETQLLIASGGFVYLLTLATNAFVQLATSNFTLSTGPAPVKQVVFCDSFFLALIANSQTICISNVLDGSGWNLNGQIVVNVYPDNVVGMVTDHREVWMMGRKKTVVYFASGSLSVFDVSPGGFIEQGSDATFGASQLDNSIFWVGGDERGDRIGWRATGYSAQRITTHAIENAWQSYPKGSDAVSYSYQDHGHTFWVVYFPSANGFKGATWCFDVATGLWHERDLLNPTTGDSLAHPSWNHSFAFGQHIVGDWNTSNLYVMSINLLTNDGIPIIRLRASPHVSNEMEFITHSRFELDMDVGLPQQQGLLATVLQAADGGLWKVTIDDTGLLHITKVPFGAAAPLLLNDPGNSTTWIVGVNTTGNLTTTSLAFSSQPTGYTLVSNTGVSAWNLQVTSIGLLQTTKFPSIPLAPTTATPQIFLDWSDDGGKTWSNKQGRSMGAIGQTKTRVVWRRLGRARVRTYRITCSETIPIRLFDAYVNAQPGFAPTERISHQLRKSA